MLFAPGIAHVDPGIYDSLDPDPVLVFCGCRVVVGAEAIHHALPHLTGRQQSRDQDHRPAAAAAL
jgi:hypothetical protein